MNLSEIRLDKITEEEFDSLHSHWYKNKFFFSRFDVARIVNPIVSDDPAQLITDFIKHRYSLRVSVYSNNRWIKYYYDKIETKEINKIIEALKQDKEKQIELHFAAEYTERTERTKIRLKEIDGVLIGYDMVIDMFHHDWFSWINEPEYKKKGIYGLWVPDNSSHHNQIYLPDLDIECDMEIADVIRSLNKIDGVKTTNSCWKVHEANVGYVNINDESGDFIRYLKERLDERKEYKLDSSKGENHLLLGLLEEPRLRELWKEVLVITQEYRTISSDSS